MLQVFPAEGTSGGFNAATLGNGSRWYVSEVTVFTAYRSYLSDGGLSESRETFEATAYSSLGNYRT